MTTTPEYRAHVRAALVVAASELSKSTPIPAGFIARAVDLIAGHEPRHTDPVIRAARDLAAAQCSVRDLVTDDAYAAVAEPAFRDLVGLLPGIDIPARESSQAAP